MSERVELVVVPQVNVNDDDVVLARWHVAAGATVAAGDPICDVETTKAASEITAPRHGVIAFTVEPGIRIAVGGVLAAIGASASEASAALASSATQKDSGASTISATAKARALAARHGISLEAVHRSGVRGTIKESDVQRFVGGGDAKAAAPVSPHLIEDGPISPFDVAVATSLRRAGAQLISTTVDMDCRLSAAHGRIKDAQSRGVMLSTLHLLVSTVSQVLPKFPQLTSLIHNNIRYRHRQLDVAFVARTSDGRLFTPVLKNTAALTPEEIAKVCAAATLRAMRGTLKAEELEGAAFTISQVPVAGTTRVVALPSYGQSAILGVSAERQSVEWVAGVAQPVPIVTLTLNYDHALCDGVLAANFLSAVVVAMETPQA